MNASSILICVLGFGGVLIVVLNDMLIRQSTHDARSESANPKNRSRETQWSLVITLVIGIAIYAYLWNHPELTDRDFGPLNPIRDHFFPREHK